MKKYLMITMLFTVAIAASAGLKVGDKAVDFTLINVDNKEVTLSDYATDKGVVIIFTCNHCPYAIAYEDRLIALHKKYADKGFPFIFVNPNDEEIVPGDSFEGMQKRAKEKSFPFPYVKDETQEIYRQYGATNTPHVYVLTNENDGLVVSYIGTIDDNYREPESVEKTYLADALDALLADKEPNPASTKAIGCSIKDKSKSK